MVGNESFLQRAFVSYVLWDRMGTTNRGVLMNKQEEYETEDKQEEQQQECSDEYCEICECDPCDCLWGTDQ